MVTGIGRIVVAIIAAFAGANDPIAAEVFAAISFACVLIQVIAIITSFVAWILRTQAFSKKAIAASSDATIVETGIPVGVVAIITGFALLNDPIAAAGQSTVIGAGIGIVLVAIVAVFGTDFDKAIAAAGVLAAGDAGIVISHVAVIAVLKA